MWELISDAYGKVIAALGSGDDPPVLSLKRRMIIGTEKFASRGVTEATLIFVEGFEPGIFKGYAGHHPYWPAKEGFEPTLKVSWKHDPGGHEIVAYQALAVSQADGAALVYDNPNHAPGELEPWQCGRDFDPPEGEGTERGFVAHQGSVIFVSGTHLEMSVEGARVANLRVLRFAKPFGDTADGASVFEDAKSPGQSIVTETTGDTAAWSQIHDSFNRVYDDLRSKREPPVLFLVRRPVVSTDEPTNVFAFKEMSCRGIMLFAVEGFSGVQGGPDPKLKVRGGVWTVENPSGEPATERQRDFLLKYRRRANGTDRWQDVERREIRLDSGDNLFAANSILTLEVEHAQVANVWIAGFGAGRPLACGATPCP
jgi:hypothetical protein